MTNGEPLVVQAAIKPISTMTQPLRSVDTETKEPAQAMRERTDSTVVPAAAVVAEAMVALVLAGAYREKFGGDHIDDVHAAIAAYRERIGWRRIAAEPPRLVFIGFMAAGKTRAAEAVAERLELGVIDTDELLEGELGEPIASFFEREGETEFRRREERLVVSVLDALAGQVGGPSSVVALGGGAIESEAVRRALAAHMPVWCDVDEEVAWERASGSDRPLAVDRAEFAERFASGGRIYESLARAILPSAARDAAGPAAPWLAAMQGAPGVRMVWAESESGSYPAAVGEGAIGLLDDAREALPEALPARTFCVADDEALRHHRSLLPRTETIIGVQGAETSKTIAEAERVLSELASAGANRDDCVLAFGGGVVGDLAGFCAATYQRGVALVQAPTTLVAQVDSAYGGKTGVDLPEAKNYVGAYHMPIAVLADPATLRDPPRARSSPPASSRSSRPR